MVVHLDPIHVKFNGQGQRSEVRGQRLRPQDMMFLCGWKWNWENQFRFGSLKVDLDWKLQITNISYKVVSSTSSEGFSHFALFLRTKLYTDTPSGVCEVNVVGDKRTTIGQPAVLVTAPASAFFSTTTSYTHCAYPRPANGMAGWAFDLITGPACDEEYLLSVVDLMLTFVWQWTSETLHSA